MNSTRLRSALALLVLCAAAPTAAQDVPLDHAERVDEVFERWDLATSPGCAVGVSWDGLTILERAYGMANLEFAIPNTPETIFEAGSVSKQFTAAAALLLDMDGEISLSDDVRQYVPEVPDYGHTITLRHMMNHTSGLRDWGSVAAISGWGRSNRTHTHDHVVDILSRQTRLNFEPGHEYSYSNSGYNLLAVIVARVSDRSFRDFSAERIFEPLGLESTQWRDDYQRIVPGRSTAYSPRGDGFRIDQPIEDVHGNGGLLTTVGDLLTWARSFDEARLGAEFVERMERQGVLNNGRTIAYAKGLSVGGLDGVRSVTHTGSTSGYRAFLGRYYPEDHQLAVALLCNVSNANPGGLGRRVVRIYLGDAVRADQADEEAVPSEVVELPESRLRELAGVYARAATGQAIVVELREGRLFANGDSLVPTSDTDFRVAGTSMSARFVPEDGPRPTLVTVEDGFEADRFLPVEAWSPTVADLQDFVGTYHGEDAKTTYTVSLEDGELVLERYPNPVSGDLEPAPYADAFDRGTVRFRRDASGRVVEMSRYFGRVYDMRFRRVER